jgi:hypothetical protein
MTEQIIPEQMLGMAGSFYKYRTETRLPADLLKHAAQIIDPGRRGWDMSRLRLLFEWLPVQVLKNWAVKRTPLNLDAVGVQIGQSDGEVVDSRGVVVLDAGADVGLLLPDPHEVVAIEDGVLGCAAVVASAIFLAGQGLRPRGQVVLGLVDVRAHCIGLLLYVRCRVVVVIGGEIAVERVDLIHQGVELGVEPFTHFAFGGDVGVGYLVLVNVVGEGKVRRPVGRSGHEHRHWWRGRIGVGFGTGGDRDCCRSHQCGTRGENAEPT